MGILDRIVRTKQRELESLRPREAELAARVQPCSKRPFLEKADQVRLIAEVKRRSPSAGAIATTVDPAEQAAAYEAGGAAAISVLTDRDYFGGELADLEAVAARVALPILRKDFTLEPVQIYEAAVAGASAILLIARILTDAQLAALHACATESGLAALVEVHNEAEVGRALDAGATIIGVNNRDLDVFTTDLGVTERLARLVPKDVILVGESGIRARADVERLAHAGVDAVLVGEALMRGASVREMSSVPRQAR